MKQSSLLPARPIIIIEAWIAGWEALEGALRGEEGFTV